MRVKAPKSSPSEGSRRPESTADSAIALLSSLVPAIAGVFGRNCEVVVHDLRIPEQSIVAIANGHVTGRRLGGPLVGGPFGDVALRWIHQQGEPRQTKIYETKTRDGRLLKSATVLYRDELGKPYAALCVNHDLNSVTVALSWMSDLIRVPQVDPPADTHEPVGPSDVDDVLAQMIQDAMEQYRSPPLSKHERGSLVKELDEKGAFLVRGAVSRVARAVGVSKFTIYSDLDRARNGS